MQNQPSLISFQQETTSHRTGHQQYPNSPKSSTSSTRRPTYTTPYPQQQQQQQQQQRPPSTASSRARRPSQNDPTTAYEPSIASSNRRTPPPPLKRKPVASRASTGARSNYSSTSAGRNIHDLSLPSSVPQSPVGTSFADLPADQARDILSGLDILGSPLPVELPASTVHAPKASDLNSLPPDSRPSPLSRMTAAVQPQIIVPQRLEVQTVDPNKQQASSKISSFFGWRGGNASAAATPITPIADSSPTTISSDSEHSPYVRSPTTFASSVKSVPPQIDISKANNAVSKPLLSANYLPPPTPTMNAVLDEMEEELKDLSSELAASIRREMELEDEVERLQNGSDRGRRTSDYFSDSAASSVKDDGAARDRTASEELEKLKRVNQQEKAQLKLELAQKLEQERSKRKAMEEHIQTLQNHVAELERNGAPQGDRTGELERRLAEEREMKQNYEDLLNALKGDLSRHQSERDNLRDEVVPQLRARVDGLEAEVAQYATMEYEHSKMQQELQAAKGGGGLSRGQSVRKGARTSRSGSVKGQNLMNESKETLAERVKDSEAQRDALHKALKSLLQRHKLHQITSEKHIHLLEAERDAAIEANSPQGKVYAAEVKNLRFEVNTLRGRAEDAIESKWQTEKSLAGLKMDLDRADQETTSLRELLKQNDILIPDLLPGQAAGDNSTDATSITLEHAYRELRKAQSSSVKQLKEVSGQVDDKTDAALDELLKSLEDGEGSQYRPPTANSATEVHSFKEMENQSLATQIEAGAARIKLLSTEVRRQLLSNSGLRERLGHAVSKGEREQRNNAERITTLQSRLRTLEDRLVQAQSHSEEKVTENEDVVRNMSKNDNPQVKRVTRAGRLTGSPNLSPAIGGPSPARSPIMASTPGIKTPVGPKPGSGQSLADALRTEYLEGRVAELEKALAETDKEMQEVVQRMNMAQIEVMELQSQRDDAIKQTRNLQEQVLQENANMGGLMARMAKSVR